MGEGGLSWDVAAFCCSALFVATYAIPIVLYRLPDGNDVRNSLLHDMTESSSVVPLYTVQVHQTDRVFDIFFSISQAHVVLHLFASYGVRGWVGE